MDASRFDALTQIVINPSARRSLIRGGALSAMVALVAPEAAAACKKVGQHCGKKKCCHGARCRHGRCRCKQGWAECVGDGLCRHLDSDATHCGGCQQVCLTGCCVDGACHGPCGADCCADCYVEADGPNGPIHQGTEFCCPAALMCPSNTVSPDLCCWPNEVCLSSACCRDGGLGTVVCGGACCSSGSCCNGKCCAGDQVCARTKKNTPRKCVSAARSCSSDGDCFAGEACWGGTCCFPERQCHELGPNTPPVCCSVGMYCDVGFDQCCANGKICSTAKKVRIHA